MNGPKFKDMLAKKVFPILDMTHSNGGYIWTQDGASCHTS